MTSFNVGNLLDALTAADATTPVLTDTGDILLNPMVGMGPGGQADLTFMPVPPEPGETQTVADLVTMLSAYDVPGESNSAATRTSPVLAAPLGAAALALTGVFNSGDALVLTTTLA